MIHKFIALKHKVTVFPNIQEAAKAIPLMPIEILKFEILKIKPTRDKIILDSITFKSEQPWERKNQHKNRWRK